MKITKAIYLSFNGSTSTSTISIPFKVSRIHVKGIGYTPQNQPAAGAAIYGSITSDLVDYQPLGLFYNDSTYSYATNKDLELTLHSPRTINGTYTFYLQNAYNDNAVPYNPTGAGVDDVILILEFNSDNEIL
jgi:hypothetical protein